MAPHDGRTLSDADIEALKAALTVHHCRFSIPQEEFEQTWPVMRDMAKSVHTAQAITLKVVVTGTILFFLGVLGRGLWVWLGEMHAKIGTLPVPK